MYELAGDCRLRVQLEKDAKKREAARKKAAAKLKEGAADVSDDDYSIDEEEANSTVKSDISQQYGRDGRPIYPYEPLPRSGLAHPFVQAILSPWLGPEADQEDIQLGLTTLRTWWQHRRKGESASAIAALDTEKMIGCVDGYTRHFFNLAHNLIVVDKEQPPRTLHGKLKDIEKGRTKFKKRKVPLNSIKTADSDADDDDNDGGGEEEGSDTGEWRQGGGSASAPSTEQGYKKTSADTSLDNGPFKKRRSFLIPEGVAAAVAATNLHHESKTRRPSSVAIPNNRTPPTHQLSGLTNSSGVVGPQQPNTDFMNAAAEFAIQQQFNQRLSMGGGINGMNKTGTGFNGTGAGMGGDARPSSFNPAAFVPHQMQQLIQQQQQQHQTQLQRLLLSQFATGTTSLSAAAAMLSGDALEAAQHRLVSAERWKANTTRSLENAQVEHFSASKEVDDARMYLAGLNGAAAVLQVGRDTALGLGMGAAASRNDSSGVVTNDSSTNATPANIDTAKASAREETEDKGSVVDGMSFLLSAATAGDKENGGSDE